MKKKYLLFLSVLIFLFLTGCSIPNLYDVDLPESSSQLQSTQASTSNDDSDFSSDFTSEDFDIKIENKSVIITNKYVNDDITYAWYVIDNNTNEAIIKESYTASNFYKFSPTIAGTFKIQSYIKDRNGNRKSIIAITISYDGEKITLDKSTQRE